MKLFMTKLSFAMGFILLVSFVFMGLGFFIDKYDLLAKEYSGPYPANKSIDINTCTKASEKEVRLFDITGEPATGVPILTYHRIIQEKDLSSKHRINGSINPMIVTTENFKRQMNYLKENGYVTLTLNELYAFMNHQLDIPEKSVVITFDDGYKDNYIEAYPLLKKYGFNAANFIITGSISNRYQPYRPRHVQYFSTEELSEACDVFEYASHTYNLHHREGKEKDSGLAYLLSKSEKEVRKDLKTSIDHLEGDTLGFAYPYGEYSPATIKTLHDLGFKMAFTTEEALATPEAHIYEIPRFQIFHDVSFKTFKSYVNQ
ncbi:polysaccharide deacetylase family protein [Rossellomorea sp. NS-SX7]|uniref:polysaccharide deacetylase family protein n=1 Tax=Rossellomorea sp. NS-SX7 TaxID=3463856 RepID=UPI004059C5E9